MGLQDKAKHLATLFLEDLSDFISENVDENFGFSRYAERLGRSANQFNELYTALNQQHTYIDTITLNYFKKRKLLSKRLNLLYSLYLFRVTYTVLFGVQNS